jgi:hypothetical protein
VWGQTGRRAFFPLAARGKTGATRPFCVSIFVAQAGIDGVDDAVVHAEQEGAVIALAGDPATGSPRESYAGQIAVTGTCHPIRVRCEQGPSVGLSSASRRLRGQL